MIRRAEALVAVAAVGLLVAMSALDWYGAGNAWTAFVVLDVVLAAVGRPEMVRADWIKPGATVIDVGVNRREDGLVGDVAFAECSEVAGAITPVPGGVGPMTIAMLLRNTLDAARMQHAAHTAVA